MKTIVLIGKFLGELNSLKEAIGGLNSAIRCISFTETENALNILLKDESLRPDFILLDEKFPPQAFPLLKAITPAAKRKNVPIILFTRNQSADPPPASGIFHMKKCPNKKEYIEFLRKVIDLEAEAQTIPNS